MLKSLPLGYALAALALTPAAAFTQAPGAAELAEAALRAHGGADVLGKARWLARETKGVMHLPDTKIPFAAIWTMDLPERFRVALDLEAGGGKTSLVVVVNKDRGWRSAGVTSELAAAEVAELREDAYYTWLTTLAPLTDKGFTLAAIPGVEVNGKPTRGLRVSRKGESDVSLYFDAATNLLVKGARRGKEAGLTVDKEYFYAQPKSFQGAVLPTQYTELTAGKKAVEATISYRLLPRVEDNLFTRP